MLVCPQTSATVKIDICQYGELEGARRLSQESLDPASPTRPPAGRSQREVCIRRRRGCSAGETGGLGHRHGLPSHQPHGIGRGSGLPETPGPLDTGDVTVPGDSPSRDERVPSRLLQCQ
jgi:hypothetical protein